MGELTPIGAGLFDAFAGFAGEGQRGELEKTKLRAGDYVRDGLVWCGECNTPRQIRRTFPEFGVREYILPVACGCQLRQMEARKEKRRAESREECRIRAFPNAKHREMTIERSSVPLGIAERYAANWERAFRENIGLYLHGTVGSGKTYMAAAIANRLIDRGEHLVYMNNMAVLTAMLSDNYGGGRAEALEIIKYSRLLVVDDFGVVRDTDFTAQFAYELFELRGGAAMPLIVTSNVTIEEMKGQSDRRLERVFSRLSSLHPIAVAGADRRKLETNRRYHDVKRMLEGD